MYSIDQLPSNCSCTVAPQQTVPPERHLDRPFMRRTLITLVFSALLVSTCPLQGQTTRYVDPFIGAANGGNTFPGAVLPWGMVSVSPHTDLHAPSGYVHGQPWFYGLG